MLKRFSTILMLVMMATLCVRAEELVLTLDDAVAMARVRSVDAAVALDRLRSAYREWRIWRADRLPEVVLQATLPSYADQYSPYMDSDGQYSFVRNRALQLNAALAVKQNIRLTGATLQLSTSLDFLRQFDGLGNRYMALPVALSLTQPLFAVNPMKWDSRIEPVRYTEAKAEFLSATEDVALKAINYYFNLLLSRENYDIARQNYDIAMRLRDVAAEKRRMGQISENDLRQMELNLLEAQSSLTDCASDMKANMFSLRTFLDIDNDSIEIMPVVPAEAPAAEIRYADALEHARANNK
ncbi:MAG: TolC family protein, partial [Muribaculaceae bacterium]|nr:TolC family protein [Muribaculaceae bacterium]